MAVMDVWVCVCVGGVIDGWAGWCMCGCSYGRNVCVSAWFVYVWRSLVDWRVDGLLDGLSDGLVDGLDSWLFGRRVV